MCLPIFFVLMSIALASPQMRAIERLLTDTQHLLDIDDSLSSTRVPTRDHFPDLGSSPVSFSSGFSDFAVLQREPHSAAVYGMPGEPFKLPAVVTVTVSNSSGTKKYTAHVTNMTGLGEWKVILDPQPAGGDYSISAACTQGCDDSSSVTIQHVTYGDIWYCAGQSNMQLVMRHTFARNTTFDMLAAGKYHNLRIYQHPQIGSRTPLWVQPQSKPPPPGKIDLRMRWNLAEDAAKFLKNYNHNNSSDLFHPAANQTILNDYGAICMYFGVALTDLMRSGSDDASDVPLGLMDVSWGGTMIEQWSTNETTKQCTGTSLKESSGTLYNGMVCPFINMTIKGWLWYQGENNIGRGTKNPYFPSKLGYACQLPAMLKLWRQTWQANTPFGVVDIHAGGSEGQGGYGAMGNFRWAQTASYGVLPNPAMPNSFMANAYDLGDPWAKHCFDLGCCTDWTNQPQYHNITRSPTCIAPWDINKWSWDDTTYYMGPIHARPKLPVAKRLASGAWNSVYAGTGPLSGPVISSCKVSQDSIEIGFNNDLLAGDSVTVQKYNSTLHASAMQAYMNNTLDPHGWIIPDKPHGTNWSYVDIESLTSTSIKVDLTSLPPGTSVGGLRYAWQNRYGCGDLDMSKQPCPFNSHPIILTNNRLPAMPFIVRIVDGQCSCIPPQKC